jgi:hypothetical protein
MKKLLFIISIFCFTVNLFAQSPLGIELGMPVENVNNLFEWPQYDKSNSGTYFQFNPDLLKNTSAHVFKSYRGGERYIFFKDGVVIGLYFQSGRLIPSEMIGKDARGNMVLVEWNKYIDNFKKRWGDPVITNTLFSSPAETFYDAIYDDKWILEAVFPNGIKCSLAVPERNYYTIIFRWGEMIWK